MTFFLTPRDQRDLNTARRLARKRHMFVCQNQDQAGLFFLLYRLNPAPGGESILAGMSRSVASLRKLIDLESTSPSKRARNE
jgi:hypothetical protein